MALPPTTVLQSRRPLLPQLTRRPADRSWQVLRLTRLGLST